MPFHAVPDLDRWLYLNGVDARTGEYLVAPIPLEEVGALIRRTHESDPASDRTLSRWLKQLWSRLTKVHLGLPAGVSPERLDQAGWGVVFLSDESQDVRHALEPLLERRRAQAGEDRFRILDFQPGQDTWAKWLGRHGAAPGSIEPTAVPYYLLLVGSPTHIPFLFGHQLSTEYAVGCLHFETPDEYRRYAESIVRYETAAEAPTSDEVVYFGTRHPGDGATLLSAEHLVTPLAQGPGAPATQRTLLGPDATKDALQRILLAAAEPTPSILFTATHGCGTSPDDPDQRRLQGALLCHFESESPEAEHYFSAEDLSDVSRVHGLIAFHFACYSAGTPTHERYLLKGSSGNPLRIAPEPFYAALPQALLSHPSGGALACIGHVERAWGCSIRPPHAGPHIAPFRNTIDRLLAGQPVGLALRDFRDRYAAVSTELSSLYEHLRFGAKIADDELVYRWIVRNDAEGYVIFGDPAVTRVRLEVEEWQLVAC